MLGKQVWVLNNGLNIQNYKYTYIQRYGGNISLNIWKYTNILSHKCAFIKSVRIELKRIQTYLQISNILKY